METCTFCSNADCFPAAALVLPLLPQAGQPVTRVREPGSSLGHTPPPALPGGPLHTCPEPSPSPLNLTTQVSTTFLPSQPSTLRPSPPPELTATLSPPCRTSLPGPRPGHQ